MTGVIALLVGKNSSKIKMEIGLSYLKQSQTNIFRFDMLSFAFPMETMTSMF
jgi:hypothetical protein